MGLNSVIPGTPTVPMARRQILIDYVSKPVNRHRVSGKTMVSASKALGISALVEKLNMPLSMMLFIK